MTPEILYEQKKATLDDCLALIQNGDSIAVSGAITEPVTFLGSFQRIIPRLENVTVVKSKDNDYAYLHDPATYGHVQTLGHFYGPAFRAGHELGLTSYLPSDLHNYMSERVRYKPSNVFVAKVADMENGVFQVPYCQMFEKEAYEAADTIILEVNPRFRRVKGALDIPIERVTAFFISDTPFFTIPRSVPTEMDRKIGRYVAELIPDGSCIQLGIGGLPDAVGEYLKEKNDLGIHTEVLSSSMADLIENGNATGKYKNFNPGEHIASFCLGDEHLYQLISENQQCRLVPSSYGNDPFVISQNNNMVSVNTAMEIDITGQICSESVGSHMYSGTGGATDYAYGAMHSKGGRGIVAFQSTTKNGTVSKIKAVLSPGAGVSITRNQVDTIITEYGVAELRGRSIRERVDALIAIAHPKFREELREQAIAYDIIH